MADATTTGNGLQTQGDVPQNNDSTTVQQQVQNSLPSTVPSTTLQPNANDVNNLKTNSLSVKSGPSDSNGKKRASGTVLSIILVTIIILVAAGLFIASLRIKEEDKTKPTIAPGAEEAGAAGQKIKFKHNKKNKKLS